MIKTENLTKKFGEQIAVDHLNLSIDEGSSYALLGPNGAGKTTTLKLMSTLLIPTSGKVFINGQEMQRNNKKIKQQLGMVSQHFSLQRDMTPIEVLKLHGMIHQMNAKQRNQRIEELIDFAGMTKESNKLISKLSGGNKRKLMIIRAVMHCPNILFLDEPTVGLDASIRRSIWDLLRKLKNEGMTTILTTHYIQEAEALCDKIGMMNKGKIVAQDSPQGFINAIPAYVVESFNNQKTDYQYFDTREEATKCVSTHSGNVTIRETNLEDAYIKYTDRKIFMHKE